MAKVKLTKTAVDAATFGAKAYELRDTVVPGFLQSNARWPKDLHGSVSNECRRAPEARNRPVR
jgi:hypothetical protein